MESHVGFMSLVVVWFFLPSLLLTPLCANNEGDWLYAFRTITNDPRNVLISWDPSLINPCTWFHIRCDDNSHVIGIDLGNAGLSGNISLELGKLTYLQYLELYENNLSGPIPPELGNLTNLLSLDLYSNRLTGPIPNELGHLKSLRFLRLHNNDLCGRIPVESLSNGKLENVTFYPNPRLCNPTTQPCQDCK